MKNVLLALILVMLVVGCSANNPPSPSQPTNSDTLNSHAKIGLLMSGAIADQTWNSQAYRALKQIKKQYGVEVDYKENVISKQSQIAEAGKMAANGFTLVIGNGAEFQKAFNEVAVKYPSTHFVFFNANPVGKNVTANSFTPSLGYFSGMIAGLYTKTHKIGVIPAFTTPLSVSAFIEAAKEQDPRNQVFLGSVGSWDDKSKAGKITNKMLASGVDILAPMGDGYNIEVTMRASKAHAHVIGYVSDLAYMADNTVITSAQQNLMAAYSKIADDYFHNRLYAGKILLDFKDKAQYFSTFNGVSTEIQKKVMERINEYNEGKFKMPTFPDEGELRENKNPNFSAVY
jgi:transcriptional activator of comK gene